MTLDSPSNFEREQRAVMEKLRIKASTARAAAEQLPLGLDERRNAIASAQAFEAQADEIAADLGE